MCGAWVCQPWAPYVLPSPWAWGHLLCFYGGGAVWGCALGCGLACSSGGLLVCSSGACGAFPGFWAHPLSWFSSVSPGLCILGVFPSGVSRPAVWPLLGSERSPYYGKVLCLGPSPTHQLQLRSDLKP
ncbi:hypothetical protein LDENG_00187540 [Lucifuga dentata]|nr:hypothetical protein LDENG_00187540 [Lucifuga dentata]